VADNRFKSDSTFGCILIVVVVVVVVAAAENYCQLLLAMWRISQINFQLFVC